MPHSWTPKVEYSPYYRADAFECKKCHILRPLSDFHKNPRNVLGVIYHCKNCVRERTRAYYRKNREQILAFRRSPEYKLYQRAASRKAYAKRRISPEWMAKERLRVKLRSINGLSKKADKYREGIGRALYTIQSSVKKEYGVHVDIKEFKASVYYPAFLKLYYSYKRSGKERNLSPSLIPRSQDQKVESLEDFVLVPYYGKIRWKNERKRQGTK